MNSLSRLIVNIVLRSVRFFVLLPIAQTTNRVDNIIQRFNGIPIDSGDYAEGMFRRDTGVYNSIPELVDFSVQFVPPGGWCVYSLAVLGVNVNPKGHR